MCASSEPRKRKVRVPKLSEVAARRTDEPAHTISIVPAFLFSVNAKMSPRARMLSYTLI